MQNQRTTGTEQYYTPIKTASHCVQVLDTYASADTYLEPAGGTGAFLHALTGRNVISYDIEPKADNIQQVDSFLNVDLSHLSNVITISNPPFGRNHALSVPFFNHAASCSNYIAFIIPKSWRKWSVINRLNQHFHLIHDEDLTVDFHYLDQRKSSTGKLNTIFQIWQRKQELRPLVTIVDHNFITKVKDPTQADLALTIFGRGCGLVRSEFESESKTTQMYLQVNQPWVYDVLPQLDYSRYSKNVAFVEALSLMEINQLLNEQAPMP